MPLPCWRLSDWVKTEWDDGSCFGYGSPPPKVKWAFTAFHRYFPGAPLLIDTYDTIAAAQLLSEWVSSGEMELAGVRLDSGDLVALSQQVRSLYPVSPSLPVAIWMSTQIEGSWCAYGYGLGTD